MQARCGRRARYRRTPEAQQRQQTDDGRQRTEDVSQVRAHVIRDRKLHRREADTAHGCRGQCGAQRGPSPHDEHEIRRNEHRQRSTDAPDFGAQCLQRQAGDARQGDERCADGTERNRRGVGDKRNGCCLERRKAETGEHGGRHRHGRAESGRPLEEGAERKGDQQRLQARISGETAYRVADDRELSGFLGQPIEHDGPVDDPDDGQEAECRAEGCRAEHEGQRHSVDPAGDQAGGEQAQQARLPGGHSQQAQRDEQDENRQRGAAGRQRQTVADGHVDLVPHDATPRSTRDERGRLAFWRL